jgi:hypothetical protein
MTGCGAARARGSSEEIPERHTRAAPPVIRFVFYAKVVSRVAPTSRVRDVVAEIMASRVVAPPGQPLVFADRRALYCAGDVSASGSNHAQCSPNSTNRRGSNQSDGRQASKVNSRDQRDGGEVHDDNYRRDPVHERLPSSPDSPNDDESDDHDDDRQDPCAVVHPARRFFVRGASPLSSCAAARSRASLKITRSEGDVRGKYFTIRSARTSRTSCLFGGLTPPLEDFPMRSQSALTSPAWRIPTSARVPGSSTPRSYLLSCVCSTPARAANRACDSSPRICASR